MVKESRNIDTRCKRETEGGVDYLIKEVKTLAFIIHYLPNWKDIK